MKNEPLQLCFYHYVIQKVLKPGNEEKRTVGVFTNKSYQCLLTEIKLIWDLLIVMIYSKIVHLLIQITKISKTIKIFD